MVRSNISVGICSVESSMAQVSCGHNTSKSAMAISIVTIGLAVALPMVRYPQPPCRQYFMLTECKGNKLPTLLWWRFVDVVRVGCNNERAQHKACESLLGRLHPAHQPVMEESQLHVQQNMQ